MRFPLLLMAVGLCVQAARADVPEAIKTINAVGTEGTGNAEAAKAWGELVKAGPDALFPILKGIVDGKPTAANWLRTAVDAIAEKQAKAGGKFDATRLTAFVTDMKEGATARTVAFVLLQKQEPAKANAMLGDFVDDPSLDLRRDGIEHLFNLQTTRGSLPGADVMAKLFRAARDKDQVEKIAKELTSLKRPADITKHFGYITQWSLSPNFDNKDGLGYAKVYAPETDAERKGWKAAQSGEKYGFLDLNAALGKKMNAIAYSEAIIVADVETPAELRVASQNAVKFFHNGKEVFAREEYHHGTKMDQHVAKLTLAKGKNAILLKVCQNDMPYDWAQVWGFAARLCDSTGGALGVKQLIDDKPVSLGEVAPAAPKESK